MIYQTPTLERLEQLRGQAALGREEAAEVLRVSVETICYLHRMGQLPGFRIGRRLAWRPSDVFGFVDQLAGGAQ